MGTTETAPIARTASHRALQQRSSDRGEWHSVGVADWRSLVRFARAVWQMNHRRHSFSPLESDGPVGAHLSPRTESCGRARRSGLGAPFCGWQYCAGSSTCSRSKQHPRSRCLRSSAVPAAQSGEAPDQPPETVSPGGDPPRKVGG